MGTAVGYSALLMAQVMPAGCRITTIEKYKPRIREAEKNFKEAGQEERITLVEGDAEELLGSLEGPYDFIFMDAAKGQYIRWLPRILALMPVGGCCFPTMCSRTEPSSSPGSGWSGETGPYTAA